MNRLMYGEIMDKQVHLSIANGGPVVFLETIMSAVSTATSAPPEPELGRAALGGPAVALDRFSYDDAIVRAFTLMTLVWALVAFLAGLVVAFELVLPSLSASMPGFVAGWMKIPQLGFGRLR